MADDLLIRCMSRAELDLAVDWAAAEGWNPGLGDAAAFHAADPEGYLVGILDGAPVGSISVVRYGHRHGFLGFYIVAPVVRGRGVGLKLWQAGMARLAGRSVGLDGVPAQQENYRQSGFALSWRNVRLEGDPPPLDHRTSLDIVDARTIPFDRVAAFDRAFFPVARDAFLSLWIALPGHRALAALRDGAIVGLAVARPCRRGTKVGPLYADGADCALALLAALDAPVLPRPIVLDVPEPNGPAMRLAEELGLAPAFETARMVAGPPPAIALDRLYGVTTFELG
jgi:hypothetical protein